MNYFSSSYNAIFKDKVVLITGHTGFKGSWLSLWLTSLGAKVEGLSIDVPTKPSNFSVCSLDDVIVDHRLDVRDSAAVKEVIYKVQPDYVFHLAAQALVRSSYDSPLETLSTNAIGTANVLDALRMIDKSVAVVMITSDKAYYNEEWVWGYRETDRLGGKDPYSASKAMAELVVDTYFQSFFKDSDSNVRIGIARAGNVIGGGDWAKDRIVPDCVSAWSNNECVDVRSPNSTRPWQHVLEPLSGYLSMAVDLSSDGKCHGEAYNFGPSMHQDHSVRELIEEMAKHWKNVRWNDVGTLQENRHEARLLKLNCDKAFYDLDWRPVLTFEETIQMTIGWYKEYYQNKNFLMRDFTIDQIKNFEILASKRRSFCENSQ